MDRTIAVLLRPELALVRWPDGQVTEAWCLPAGTMLEVDDVVPTVDGFVVLAHPVGDPQLFTLVDVRDVELVDEPVPF